MKEHRSSQRYKVQKQARIEHVNGTTCIVRELSATGARISSSGTALIQNRFDLVLLREGLVIPVRVVWPIFNSAIY
jgi:hypothetical protein